MSTKQDEALIHLNQAKENCAEARELLGDEYDSFSKAVEVRIGDWIVKLEAEVSKASEEGEEGEGETPQATTKSKSNREKEEDEEKKSQE